MSDLSIQLCQIKAYINIAAISNLTGDVYCSDFLACVEKVDLCSGDVYCSDFLACAEKVYLCYVYIVR